MNENSIQDSVIRDEPVHIWCPNCGILYEWNIKSTPIAVCSSCGMEFLQASIEEMRRRGTVPGGTREAEADQFRKKAGPGEEESR